MNRKVFAAVCAAVVMLLTVSPAEAQSDFNGWRLRAFGGIVCRCVENDNVTFDDPDFGSSSTEIDGSSFGLGVSAEWRFNKLIGGEVALGYTSMDVEFNQSLTADKPTDSLRVMPLWLAANFHVVNTDKLDFWAGPQIAYIGWNDSLFFKVRGSGEPPYKVQNDNEFPGIGFTLGLDYWLSEHGGVNIGFRFVDADANANLPVDPTFITVGYTWKF